MPVLECLVTCKQHLLEFFILEAFNAASSAGSIMLVHCFGLKHVKANGDSMDLYIVVLAPTMLHEVEDCQPYSICPYF